MADTSKLSEILEISTSEAFETQILLPIESVGERTIDHSEKMVISSISYTGPIEGAVFVILSLDCAKLIACTMLMAEEGDELSDEEIEDAMGEVANLVAGGFKAKIAEDIGNITISVPTVMTGADISPSTKGHTHEADVFMKTQEHPIRILTTFKENIAAVNN
jgi:chemotaxis protein CheX